MRRRGGKRGDGRAAGVGRYAADLWDVLEGAGVGGGDDELLAKGLEAAFGGGGHGGKLWDEVSARDVRPVSGWWTIISMGGRRMEDGPERWGLWIKPRS